MRIWKTSLSDSLKIGLSRTDPMLSDQGFGALKSLKTNGMHLIACPLESFVVPPTSIGFSFLMGSNSYWTNGTVVWKLVEGVWIDLAPTILTGIGIGLENLKFLDFIGYGILIGASQKLYFDTDGVYQTSITGFDIPFATNYAVLENQIVAGGILDGFQDLTPEHIAWSKIGSDSFTVDKSNDAGFAHLQIGVIKNLVAMRQSFLVLGQLGSSLMYYAEHTFGFRKLDVPNVGGLGLAASTVDTGYYISDADSLIKVTSKGEFEDLGYAWLMKDVVSLSRIDKSQEILIQTSDMSFILDNFGIYSYGYRLEGITKDGFVAQQFEQDTVGFETGAVDNDMAGIKRLSEVALVSNATSPELLRGFGWFDLVKRYTGFVQLNSMKAVKIVVSAFSLGFGYVSDYKKDLVIRSLSVNIGKPDRRFGNGERVTRTENPNGY